MACGDGLAHDGRMTEAGRFALLALCLALVLPSGARAGEAPPVVVELFTSQGCSPCPPADAFLGELAKRPGVLALAYHVDYWNYIGWTDPFARPWASERQRAYRDRLHLRYVYTPQMVVDGAAQGIGAERETIDGLIRAAAAVQRPHPTLSLVWREDGALAVDVGQDTSPAQPVVLWLVGFDRSHKTPVLHGENGGRTLTDYQVVRHFRRLGTWIGWSLEIIVPATEVASLGDGAAVLMQVDGDGPIVTAAAVPVPKR
jgi:hypothetical protein